jgi:anion-transporting  ArsA/GET3 family ATPase
MMLEEIMRERSVVICCGAGGVGKTTTAAALALGAAERGRRACVVTIDPARRLADALGLEELGNLPTKVDGPWPGELWALMLDTKGTFDDLIRRYAATPNQAARILQNRVYKNISAAMSGTQEYMAAEKLLELHSDGNFDIVVVDTPPSRNALEFLDAPGRLTRLLENRFFRLLVTPARGYMRALSIGLRAFLRTVASVVGTDVVEDTVAFFQAFGGMEEGFRRRASQVQALLADPATCFVLVTAPRRNELVEGRWFVDRLNQMGLKVEAVVINRSHPRFLPPGSPLLARRAQLPAELAPLLDNLAELEMMAAQEDAIVAEILREASYLVAKVPMFESDIHDLEGVAAVAVALSKPEIEGA